MSTYDDELAFEETLRIQAVGAGTPALTLSSVQARARSIRRRRTGLAAGGAAFLVAAAVVPLALLVGGGSSTDSLPPADGTPTVVDSDNPVVASYPPGWIVDGGVRSSDGTSFTPAVAGEISYLHRLGADHWVLGVYPAAGGFEVVVVDSSGAVLSTHDALDSGVAGDDVGTAVAWFARDRTPRVLVAGSTTPDIWSVVGEGAAGPLEVLSGCTVDECRLVVRTRLGDGASTVLVDRNGALSTFDRFGLTDLTDVSPDGTLAAGSTQVTDDGSCSAVVRIDTGEQLWETCEHSTLRFSTDGSRVLGIDARLSGFGHSFVEVLDAADGQVVQRFDGDTIFDEAWDSAGSFLVSQQTDEGRNELVRVGIEEAEVSVLESRPGAPGDPEGIIRLGG